jgi:hypothetical protein
MLPVPFTLAVSVHYLPEARNISIYATFTFMSNVYNRKERPILSGWDPSTGKVRDMGRGVTVGRAHCMGGNACLDCVYMYITIWTHGLQDSRVPQPVICETHDSRLLTVLKIVVVVFWVVILCSIQNGSGAHPASYLMGTRGSFPGSKAAGSAEVKECVELYLHSPIRLHGVVLS